MIKHLLRILPLAGCTLLLAACGSSGTQSPSSAAAPTASAAKSAAAAPTAVTVVMRDPGCHWFAVGNGFKTHLSLKGPVSLRNIDEATLKIAGAAGMKTAPVGRTALLRSGSYTIRMVGQKPDDNTLHLTVH